MSSLVSLFPFPAWPTMTDSSDAFDPYKCNALQTDGKWIDSDESPESSDQYRHWQPPGCLLHKYNAKETESCLQCKKLLFIGDSTIRQVYWATARRLDRRKATEMDLLAEKHTNLTFEQGRTTIQFLWDPFLNSTALMSELEHHKLYDEPANSTQTAAMLLGTGLWQAKDLGLVFLDAFKQSIFAVAPSLTYNARGKNGMLLPPSARRGSQPLVVFAPVPVPIQSQLDPMRAAKLTPQRIQAMNDYLRDAVARLNIEVLWSFSLMTREHPSAYEEDGYHVTEAVADRQADIFLNMLCNSQPSFQHYPFDKTCCNIQPAVNRVQLLMVLVAGMTILCALVASFRWYVKDERSLTTPNSAVVIRAMAVIAVTTLYCFIADRTLLFDRIQKVPSQRTFLHLSTLVLIGGLATIRRSVHKSAHPRQKPTTTSPSQAFLSRDQTDEWKGWMQFLILIYHYTGMSSVLWIYQIVRLLVASYLFMTGYGHTIYFLQTNNFSLHRVASVLVRLNILSCLLAYFMRTDYNFYYFPALSSFWFLVVYLTIRIRHQPNVVPTVLVLKIIVSAILVRLFVQTPGVLELLFKILERTCKINVNVYEFRFRLSLDMYIVYAGMFAAILYLQLSGAAPCSATCLATQIKKIPAVAHVLAVVTSIIILPAYSIIVQRFPNKYNYNWWHPIISPLPVLAFVVLRNATQALRDFHSRLFAWLGRFSLETFILQYHIWLAADTKALLSLGLWTRNSLPGVTWPDKLGWCCEFILITSLFLWTSEAVADATNILTSFIVEGHSKTATWALSKLFHWRKSSENMGQKCGSLSPPGHSRSKSAVLEEVSGEKQDIKAPAAANNENLSSRSSASLAMRLIFILLLMWAGNWVSRRRVQRKLSSKLISVRHIRRGQVSASNRSNGDGVIS